jgi:hypothetical protein
MEKCHAISQGNRQMLSMSKSIAITLLFLVALILSPGYQAEAEEYLPAVLYHQPHDGTATLYQSSWWYPDESVNDQYRWDNFTLDYTRDITEIQWVGGYDPNTYLGAGAVLDFKVAIYGSNAAAQPDVIVGPLVEYQTGGNAGQMPAGTFGGVDMYNYHFVLPAAFQAQGGSKYWVYIVAAQEGNPDWGLAKGNGPDNTHFRNLHEGNIFQFLPGDFAFTLLGPPAPHGVSLSPDQAKQGSPGLDVSYTLSITNSGQVTDSFDLAAAGQSWTTNLSASLVNLGPSASADVTVTVSIPIGAADQDTDMVTITATSQGDSSKEDTAVFTTISTGQTAEVYLPVILTSTSR